MLKIEFSKFLMMPQQSTLPSDDNLKYVLEDVYQYNTVQDTYKASNNICF
jgi:hypothetical protein